LRKRVIAFVFRIGLGLVRCGTALRVIGIQSLFRRMALIRIAGIFPLRGFYLF
jgi:hypothetical protein